MECQDEINQGQAMSGYWDFLRSDYWKQVSLDAKKRAGYQCQSCGTRRGLQVHHKTYDHHGQEHLFPDDLVCLCNRCHASAHGLPVPPIKLPNPAKVAARKERLQLMRERQNARISSQNGLPAQAIDRLHWREREHLRQITARIPFNAKIPVGMALAAKVFALTKPHMSCEKY